MVLPSQAATTHELNQNPTKSTRQRADRGLLPTARRSEWCLWVPADTEKSPSDHAISLQGQTRQVHARHEANAK